MALRYPPNSLNYSELIFPREIMARAERFVARDSRLTKSTLYFKKDNYMLETIAVILLVLWLLGMVSSYTIGGFIHILLVLAIVTLLIRVIRGSV